MNANKAKGALAATLTLAAVTTLLGASGAPAAPAGYGSPGAGSYNACTRNAQFYASNPLDQVMRDEFKWATYPVTLVGSGAGDVKWAANPYKRVSWSMWLHSLRWIGSALDAALRGNEDAMVHVKTLVKDWAKDNPYPWDKSAAAIESTMHRTNVLLCLRTIVVNHNGGVLPDAEGWLDELIITHAKSLDRYFSGFSNHGTDESLALLGVGCLLDRTDYRNLAAKRLLEILDQAIYRDGSTNEQSTGYAAFNYNLWQRTVAVVRQCTGDTPLADTIDARLDALAGFLAHATTPQRTLHQIGDTEDVLRPPLAGTVQEYPATGGATGTPPDKRVATYLPGYVFGRSGWGTPDKPFDQQSAYSLRYGPKQRFHGHSDHMSLTYQAKGQPILIDAGYGEYTQDAWHTYVKGPASHNQLLIPGMTTAKTTALTRKEVGNGTPMADYYQLKDVPGAGMTRVRDVLVMSDPDVVVVTDRATSRKTVTFQQLWHLPNLTTVTADTGSAVALMRGGELNTTFLQLRYRGEGVLTRPYVFTGMTQPTQGWWWPTIFTREPSPVLSTLQRGTAVKLFTVIAPAPLNEKVTASSRLAADGRTWIYTIKVGGAEVKVELREDGSLARVP